MKKQWLLAWVLMSVSLGWPGKVGAVEIPSFPSCVNPEGTVIANYESGTQKDGERVRRQV